MMPSKLISFAIVAAIVINFSYHISYILKHPRSFQYRQSFPGKSFAGLKPFLSNVPSVGYYNDKKTTVPFSDPQIMFDYQQAQFFLSPTLLDYYHPFNYPLIIFNCQDQQTAQDKIKIIHGHIIVVLKNGVMLVRQENK